MRFQQLVFRTTPHSLVEWLDGELEKRGIDCVYTHCILSILQEDSDDTEPDECIDVRNNQQKVYHKYGGPESLYSATKSKHQKWKTYSKQILLTASISSCDAGISDLERKNRNAAINCLKSVSDDNTIEDLIDEVCLKLKNIKNVNAPEKKDSVKSLNIVEKETAFYIPPSSPTDQVEKYFAAFPPLNKKFEEKSSDQLAHLNAWYGNCIRKNKNIVQDIFKSSQIKSFQSSENSKYIHDNSYGSLKSIENIYQPENNNKALNQFKVSNSKRDGNSLKFSDENSYTQISIKKNADKVVNNSALTSMLCKNDDLNIEIISENICGVVSTKSVSDKCKNYVTNNSVCNDNTESESKRKVTFLSSSAYHLFSSYRKVKNAGITNFFTNKCLIDEISKPIIYAPKDSENLINWMTAASDENIFIRETLSNPCKKFKSSENLGASIKGNMCSGGELIDLTSENSDVKFCKVNEVVSVKKSLTSCSKSKRRKNNGDTNATDHKHDNEVLVDNYNHLTIDKMDKQTENNRKGCENSELFQKANLTSDKVSAIAVEPSLKRNTNTKKRKGKSSRLRKRCSGSGEKNLESLKPESEKSSSNDVGMKNVNATEILLSATKTDNTLNRDCMSDAREITTVTKVQLCASGSLESGDKDCEKGNLLMQCPIENSNKKYNAYFKKQLDSAESNAVDFCGENKVETAANIESTIDFCGESKVEIASDIESASNRALNTNGNVYTIDTRKGTSEINFQLPVHSEISHRNLIFPFGNINLIKIGTKFYYNFNPLRALNFFSEHEIFNIMTVGDFNEVNNFLSKFSTPSNLATNAVQDLDIELKHDANDCVVPSQEINFDDFGSKKSAQSLPIIKISPCSPTKVACEKQFTNFSLKSLQQCENDDINSFADECCKNAGFDNAYAQKQIVNDNTSVLFKNWDCNLFFDFNEGKTENSSAISHCDHFSEPHPSFSINDSHTEKSFSDVFPRKQIFNEDNCNIDTSELFYEDEHNVSVCNTAQKYNSIAAPDHVLYENYDFEEQYLSYDVENEFEDVDTFYRSIRPGESLIFENTCNVKFSSAFKPAYIVRESYVPAYSRNFGQDLLKKAVNIDRSIQKINGRNRVTSFQHLQNVSSTQPPDISKQIVSCTPINIFSNTSNICFKNKEAENMQRDSLLNKSSLLYEDNFKYLHSLLDWSKQSCLKNDKLKSIWENKADNIDSIWGSPTQDLKKENNHVSSNNTDVDAIHKEFEKEQDELLRGIYSMPHLKDETDLPYSIEQSTVDCIFEHPYKSNVVPKNESLNINTETFTGISSMHIIPEQTVSKISNGNNFDFSPPVSVDPVGVFSLDNCKSDTVDPQISCSDTNYPINIKKEAYQGSDFIDASAFRGPYGSYSESRTNVIEGGGWSLDSDRYLLESEAFHDRSSSLRDLNTMGSENESFQYMQADRQQFSSEDDEISRMNATRWQTGYMRRRIKYKYPCFKRPCAFYMEGNCNRTDCKFSHDLSNITCRFWQEGSCFKGSTCPFLHGYTEEQKIVDQHYSLHKREPEHYYSLDSETDFPSLSSSKWEKTSVAKSEPVDIVSVKGFKNSRQTNH